MTIIPMPHLSRTRDSENVKLIEKRLDQQWHSRIAVLLPTWHWYTRVGTSSMRDWRGRGKSIDELLHTPETIRRYFRQRPGNSLF